MMDRFSAAVKVYARKTKQSKSIVRQKVTFGRWKKNDGRSDRTSKDFGDGGDDAPRRRPKARLATLKAERPTVAVIQPVIEEPRRARMKQTHDKSHDTISSSRSSLYGFGFKKKS